jgi:hypothetical protein
VKGIVLALALISAGVSGAATKTQVIPSIRPADVGLAWVDLAHNGIFSARGTWTTTDLSVEDNLVGYPVNLAEIVCHREWHQCLLTQTNVTDRDWFTMRSETWNITHWTDKEIVAAVVRLCVTAELTINVPNEQAFIIEREGGYTIDNCQNERKNKFEFSTALAKPRVLVLEAPDRAIPNDPRVKRLDN